MRALRQRGRAVIVGLCVALSAAALTACDGDGGETATASEPTTAEPSTEAPPTDVGSTDSPGVDEPPDVEKPVAPEGAFMDDSMGATEAVQYYVALLDYARVSGDTAELSSMSAPECGYCSERIDAIQEIHEQGGWIEPTNPTHVEDFLVSYPTPEQDYYVVEMTLTEAELVLHDGKGNPASLAANVVPQFLMAVRWQGSSFQIVGGKVDG